jgi:hypothetical protein
MKKSIFLCLVLPLLFIGCKKEETPQPETTVPTKAAVPKIVEKECYVFEADDSTIEIQLEQNDSVTTGTLRYNLAEKDSNTGTFKGEIKNNILLAEYTFQSEGTQSTRQVAFQFRDNKWYEGYGEMTDEGTKFKDASKLDFTSSMPLSKINCPK